MKLLYLVLVLFFCVAVSRSAQNEGDAQKQKQQQQQQQQQIQDIINKMSVEDMVGQLFNLYFEGLDFSEELSEVIVRYRAGGISLFGFNIESQKRLADVIYQAQLAAKNSNSLPLIVAIDQEGGSVSRLTEKHGTALFPSQMAIGATFNPFYAVSQARHLSDQLKAFGINLNWSPVLDVNSNSLNPVIGIRSFGDSSSLTSKMGVAMLEEYKKLKMISTIKHFPGHGDTDSDSHTSLPVVNKTLDQLRVVEFPPFEAAISSGNSPSIMTAHILYPKVEPNPNLPATLSPTILQGILRTEMNFKGVIMTDSMTMSGLRILYPDIKDATRLAFEAGVDLFLHAPGGPHSIEEQIVAIEYMIELVKSGYFSMDRLRQSVERVIKLKVDIGLSFDNIHPPNEDEIRNKVGTPEQIRAADEIGLKSVTLLKDDGNVIPVPQEKKVAVIYPNLSTRPEILAEAVKKIHNETVTMGYTLEPTESEILQAAELAKNVQVAIVATFRGSVQQSALVEAVFNNLSSKQVIVVSLELPYDLWKYENISSVLMATYGNFPSQVNAFSSIVFGKATPQGKLPVQISEKYPFGHGLVKP